MELAEVPPVLVTQIIALVLNGAIGRLIQEYMVQL